MKRKSLLLKIRKTAIVKTATALPQKTIYQQGLMLPRKTTTQQIQLHQVQSQMQNRLLHRLPNRQSLRLHRHRNRNLLKHRNQHLLLHRLLLLHPCRHQSQLLLLLLHQLRVLKLTTIKIWVTVIIRVTVKQIMLLQVSKNLYL